MTLRDTKLESVSGRNELVAVGNMLGRTIHSVGKEADGGEEADKEYRKEKEGLLEV